MTIIDNLPYPESYGVNSERASNLKYSRIIQRKKVFLMRIILRLRYCVG